MFAVYKLQSFAICINLATSLKTLELRSHLLDTLQSSLLNRYSKCSKGIGQQLEVFPIRKFSLHIYCHLAV